MIIYGIDVLISNPQKSTRVSKVLNRFESIHLPFFLEEYMDVKEKIPKTT